MKTFRLALGVTAALSLAVANLLPAYADPGATSRPVKEPYERENGRAPGQAADPSQVVPDSLSLPGAARQIAESVSHYVAEDLTVGRISVQDFHHSGTGKKHLVAAMIEKEITEALANRNEPQLKLQSEPGAPVTLTGEYFLADDKRSLVLKAKLLSQSSVIWSSPEINITQGDFSELAP